MKDKRIKTGNHLINVNGYTFADVELLELVKHLRNIGVECLGELNVYLSYPSVIKDIREDLGINQVGNQ